MIIPGILRSIDGKLQRPCKVRVQRYPTEVNEERAPIGEAEPDRRICDSDNWPDGAVYEVQVEGEQKWRPLTRRHGHYVAR